MSFTVAGVLTETLWLAGLSSLKARIGSADCHAHEAVSCMRLVVRGLSHRARRKMQTLTAKSLHRLTSVLDLHSRCTGSRIWLGFRVNVGKRDGVGCGFQSTCALPACATAAGFGQSIHKLLRAPLSRIEIWNVWGFRVRAGCWCRDKAPTSGTPNRLPSSAGEKKGCRARNHL